MVKSKRSSSDSDTELGAIGKKKRRSESGKQSDLYEEQDSVFLEQLTKNGLVLKVGKHPNEIKKDQAHFQKDLQRSLKREADFPQVIDDFMEGLSNYIEDINRLFRAMMPTMTSSDCDESARGGNQDSLIRQLLSIELLQPACMNLLLEKLAEFTGDEDPIIDGGEKVNMARLIMNQFRWLNRIVNSKEVTSKMLEIIFIVSHDAQREIITCIPEVIDDSEHNVIAHDLKELMRTNNGLTVPILDALSNLTVKAELLSEIRSSVIKSLPSVELEDLPVIVKFLLQTVTATEAQEVIEELRLHLDFQAVVTPTQKSQKQRHGSDENTLRGSEALTLDAIRSGVRFQRSIAEAWIKSIEAVNTTGEHKVVDMFLLLILHSNNYKKPVESLIRNKVRAGHFTEVLLQTTFTGHAQVLRDYFPSVLSLAEILLRSPEPQIIHFSSAVYKHAFLTFDSYCQQEIVGNLVTHIGSGLAGEVDSSLNILADLVETNTQKMAPFAVFVKGVLDYLDNLTVPQIRKLYAMLSILAFRNLGSETMIQDEMHIIVRKQLTNTNTKYKRMGVIGAIMVIKSMAFYDNDQGLDASRVSHEGLPEEVYKQVVAILQLLKRSCTKCVEASALFMDELASVLKKGCLDPEVEKYINEHVISDFQDDYVVDVDTAESARNQFLPKTAQYNLDEVTSSDSEDQAIAINLHDLVIKSHDSSTNSKLASPSCLAPHFRLLQIAESQFSKGHLENIDALLGCALYLPKPDLYEKIESLSQKEKQVICECLIHAINWFIEVINAFALQSDPEYKGKVIARLQNISTVQKHLETCLAGSPHFQPPVAHFDFDTKSVGSGPGPSTSTVGVKKTTTKKGRGKKRKSGENESDDTTQAEPETQEKEEKVVIDLALYRHCFRELDMEVFTVLQTGLITKQALDTDLNTAAEITLQIQPQQLHFLLTDLVAKLQHSLVATAAKRLTFLKTKTDKRTGFSHLDELSPGQVALRAVKLLPALCDHLEGTSAFFQALIESNDGLIDGPGAYTEEAKLMGSCLHLLLQSVLAILSWNGFVMSENQFMLKEALVCLASRLTDPSISQAPMHEIVVQAFHYCENFAQTVPNIGSAVTLVKLLVTISGQTDDKDLGTKIGTLAESFLKRQWHTPGGDKEKGAKFNEQVQHLLKLHFSYSDDIPSAIERITQVGMKELVHSDDRDPDSMTYPTLTKNSYHVFYKSMLAELVAAVKVIQPGKPNDDKEVRVARLRKWNLAVHMLHCLVDFIKVYDARINLGALLKYGRMFVDIFLRQGMPLMDYSFVKHRDDVRGLLKNVQISTRALHHICSHSKIMKDVTLTNQVPPLKRCLEAFVYRVKAMLTVNKCLEAFWLGNLRNRNLRGEELQSQSTIAESSKESDSEESAPEDDDDSEVEMGGPQEESNDTLVTSDSESGSVHSYSETY